MKPVPEADVYSQFDKLLDDLYQNQETPTEGSSIGVIV